MNWTLPTWVVISPPPPRPFYSFPLRRSEMGCGWQGFNFAYFCGVLLSFYFSKTTKTFMFTGESSTKNKLFHRYLTTTRYVQKWYEGDVWDVNDSAQRTLSIVRSMHTRVTKKMTCLNDGGVYISQWDMVLGQWAFVGPIVLFRSLVGLHGWTNDDYDAILHFWRTIGYLLGIEDKLNLRHGSYNQVVTSCKKLLHKDYKQGVEKVDPISVAMEKNVTEAMSMVEPSYTWPALATYIYELVGLPCPVDMCIIDKICYSLIHFMMTYLIKFHRFRICENKLTRWKINSVERKDLQLMEK
ncbi:hypothetical protein AVEN_29726-1 [Araneus ventricosus]|uniref:ER-bound oxygenase mpaB/mpaB'/Rubber oxygenase catalytic domain-containing protein n=1 Tax=Araneus ventricosus TaxID=182803 RepID=A0A4Y2NZ17_ARAVE|nr:hypothetical protein AVEN_29726-1 [Araneus ventricosus]